MAKETRAKLLHTKATWAAINRAQADAALRVSKERLASWRGVAGYPPDPRCNDVAMNV